MTFYIRAAIAGALIFIYIFLGYLYWTSSSIGGDERALNLYKEGNYKLAKAFVEELEKMSPAAKYPLYQSYILRASGDLAQADLRLQKALARSKNESSYQIASEIYLNQAFNAYLKHNTAELGQVLKHACQTNHADPLWFSFFEGIHCYQTGHFTEAQKLLQKNKFIYSYHPWIGDLFAEHFTPFWLESCLVRCGIEEGKYQAARQKLDEMLEATTEKKERDTIHFLLGFTYFKEAQTKSLEQATPYYRLAFSRFDKIGKNKAQFDVEWKEISHLLQKHIEQLIQQGLWEKIPFYATLLESMEPWVNHEHATNFFLGFIDEKISSGNEAEAYQLIDAIGDGSLKMGLQWQLEGKMKQILREGSAERIEQYWMLGKNLNGDDAFAESMTGLLRDEALNAIRQQDWELRQSAPYINLWSRVEHSPERRLVFAIKLVNEAERLWQGFQRYDTAIHLMSIAEKLPFEREQHFIREMMEETVSRLYQRAVNGDVVKQYFQILKAVRMLNLSNVAIYDKQEALHQLGDAEYFFNKQRYQEAYEKASWVLEVEPDNQRAQRIVNLILENNALR